MSRESFEFPKYFFAEPELHIDLAELQCYYIHIGGDILKNKPTATCAERIKQALSIRRMRQSELCEITKIPKSAISEYISGAYEPKQDRVFIISKALDVDPVWLMGFDVPMESKMEIQKENSPSEPVLTEGEKLLLQLFREIPVDRQPEALELLAVALKMQKKQ